VCVCVFLENVVLKGWVVVCFGFFYIPGVSRGKVAGWFRRSPARQVNSEVLGSIPSLAHLPIPSAVCWENGTE